MTAINWSEIFGRAKREPDPEPAGVHAACGHPNAQHLKNGMCLAWLLEKSVTCECGFNGRCGVVRTHTTNGSPDGVLANTSRDWNIRQGDMPEHKIEPVTPTAGWNPAPAQTLEQMELKL